MKRLENHKRSDDAISVMKQCEAVCGVLRSISHPVRMKILCHLVDGERTVTELMGFCGISQSAMSQFLKRMKSEGVVQSRRSGSFVLYSILDLKMFRLLRALKEIYC